MMLRSLSFGSLALVAFASAFASACTTTTVVDGGAGPRPDPKVAERACETTGVTRCEGAKVQTCEDRGDGGTAWSAAVECPGDQSCREEACQDPTERQQTQAKSIDALVDALAKYSAWHEAVDAAAVKNRERSSIVKGDGADATFFAAAWRTMNAFPQGHQSLSAAGRNVCGKSMAVQQSSRFGVCGRPAKDGLAVTHASAANKLGLRVGDVVVSADGESGTAMLEAAYARPVCGGVFPAASGRQYAGAASFFGSVPAGTKLVVRAVDGSTREVVVPPDADPALTDCTDPFARNRAVYAEAQTRPDGVAVIRLPSFFPHDKPFPTDPSEYEAFRAAYEAEIVKVFETVKSAPAIVWDARGNTGGLTLVGLAIVSGFPSARATQLSFCRTRAEGSSPPSFDPPKYAEYAITPGGPFTYAGKVAVLTDGLAYSAGDYFPFAAIKASNVPVFGSATAGAFGGGSSRVELDGPPPLVASYDVTGCFDASTAKPLEGNPPVPTVAVDYEPSDLSAGKDTVLERAVKALGF